MVPQLASVFLSQTCHHWLNLLTEAGVPCGPINDIKQAINEPQVKHREMVFNMAGTYSQNIPQIANPLKFSKGALSYQIPPPILGDSTKEVLVQELGLSIDELADLKTKSVIS